MKTEITLKQKPVIEHHLENAVKFVKNEIASLNIENQVVTDETIQTLKKKKAYLNSIKKEFETSRINFEKEYNKELNAVKSYYKDNLIQEIDKAVGLYGKKITAFELIKLKEKEEKVKAYFTELCQAEEIDFLKFKDLLLPITLSKTEKSLKESCLEFIEKTKDDLLLIDVNEHKPEILVEYKETLNVSASIRKVTERKEKEAAEKEALKQREYDNRRYVLSSIGLKTGDNKVYVFNDDIYVSFDSVKDIPRVLFDAKLIEIKEEIRIFNSKEVKEKPETSDAQAFSDAIINSFHAPVKEVKQEILKASFEVSGTLAELKALKAYLTENKITFKTI